MPFADGRTSAGAVASRRVGASPRGRGRTRRAVRCGARRGAGRGAAAARKPQLSSRGATADFSFHVSACGAMAGLRSATRAASSIRSSRPGLHLAMLGRSRARTRSTTALAAGDLSASRFDGWERDRARGRRTLPRRGAGLLRRAAWRHTCSPTSSTRFFAAPSRRCSRATCSTPSARWAQRDARAFPRARLTAAHPRQDRTLDVFLITDARGFARELTKIEEPRAADDARSRSRLFRCAASARGKCARRRR